jgi:hypothetical protein
MTVIKRIRRLLNLVEKDQNSNRWKTILRTTDMHYSVICKMALEEEEIPVLIFDQRDSSYNAFGDIQLQVLNEDVTRAQKILNSSNE